MRRRTFLLSLALLASCKDATTPRIASTLTFVAQPVSSNTIKALSPAVVVAIQDDAGNTVTDAANSVTIAIDNNASHAPLVGTATVAAVRGLATFSNLNITKPGTAYRLTATSGQLEAAQSASFNIAAGPPMRLAFTSGSPVASAHAIMSSMNVSVLDAFGNLVTGASDMITLALLASPAGGSLTGHTSVAATNGVATFSDLSISKAGSGYALVATATGLVNAATAGFSVGAGPAAQLAFLTQPVAAPAGGKISPAVAVAVVDIDGNIVTNATNAVTVALDNNPASGSLTGTTTVSAVNGIALFSDLFVDNVGVGYTLSASAANLTGTSSAAFSVLAPPGFASVTAGYFHSCAIATDALAYCWGSIGSGATRPAPASGTIPFAKVSSGRDHACGVTPGNVTFCWGINSSGELGNGTFTASPAPVGVSGALVFRTAASGYAHSCGLTSSGAAYCWGDNAYGELGDGTTTLSKVPVAVAGGIAFTSISLGRYLTCGLSGAGAAYCWGTNLEGEVGDGTTSSRTRPTAVASALTFTSVSAGGFHACALTAAGAAYCWGLNSYGELGDGSSTGRVLPTPVAGGFVFASLSAGNRHTCALTANGTAYCWGDNSGGALGDGTVNSSSTPVAVAGGLQFVTISAGRFHTCGVAQSGNAYCWGQNGSGQLGNGTFDQSLLPSLVR